MKVGLLEDDLAQAERMQALLAKLGYQPEHFSTGKSLLESLRRSVHRGQPFGSASWCERIVKRLGLESTLRAPGRPKKPVKP